MTPTRALALGFLLSAACASDPTPQAEPAEQAAAVAESLAMAPQPSAPVEQAPKADGQGDPSPAAQRALTRVEPSLVCMVNNQFMGRPQIPVTVEGKTYFGCCEMCKGRLNSDPVSRTAKDPVTGADVDKALAVIAKDDLGAVLYFENEASLAKYATQ